MKKSRIIAASSAVCLAASMAITSFAATEHWNDNSAKTAVSNDWAKFKKEWENIKTDYEKLSLSPGADATKMNYAWYSKSATDAAIRISLSPDMTNTNGGEETNTYTDNTTTISGTSSEYKKINDELYYANKVTVSDLKENTTYYYQYLCDGVWSDTYHFTTGDTENFSIMYVGDPQIGSSKGQIPAETDTAQTADIAARNDAYSWNTTLTAALSDHPEIDWVISAGDQINNTSDDNGQELEYAGFLSADALTSLPIAPTIGNHDSKYANFQNHFNVANPYTEEENATPAGNDYYYSYGNALFIVLNTNNYNVASHEKLINKAIQSNPNATWKVVTFHQDIYGSGKDHSDSDGMILRTQLTTLMDKYDIDVVLQGHDHTYSRSYMLTSDGQTHTSYDNTALKDATEAQLAEFQKQNLCYSIADKTQGTVNNPNGVLYMEANSSTGSKYYNLISTQQDYIAARSQTWTPTYSVIDITKDSFTINTYDVNTGKALDQSFTITKKAETSPAPATAQPSQNVQPTPTTPSAISGDTDKDNKKDTTVAVKKIKLNKTKLTLKKGKTAVLKATVTPSNATNKTVKFSSSKKSVAKVGAKSGKVTAKKKGTATITAKCGTKKAVCKVTVK